MSSHNKGSLKIPRMWGKKRHKWQILGLTSNTQKNKKKPLRVYDSGKRLALRGCIERQGRSNKRKKKTNGGGAERVDNLKKAVRIHKR